MYSTSCTCKARCTSLLLLVSVKDLQEGLVRLRFVAKALLDGSHVRDGVVKLRRLMQRNTVVDTATEDETMGGGVEKQNRSGSRIPWRVQYVDDITTISWNNKNLNARPLPPHSQAHEIKKITLTGSLPRCCKPNPSCFPAPLELGAVGTTPTA